MTKTAHESPSLLKTALRFVPAIVALSAVALLFGPAWLVARLGLSEVLQHHRALLGVCALLCVATLVTQVLPFAVMVSWRWFKERWREGRGRKRLRALTRSEKNLLKQYLSRQTRVLVLDVSSGATSALLAAGILRRAVELDDKALGLAFNIEPWAWTYLRDNRHLLETPEAVGARTRTSGQTPALPRHDREWAARLTPRGSGSQRPAQ